MCDTFLKVSPEAPTLSGDWTARDLAAHLVVRESRPDAALGMMLPPLAGHLERVQGKIAAQDWPALVERVRSGPPRWTPFAIPQVDEAANLGEFYIHHEDVLRAQPQWAPRRLGDEMERALFAVLPRLAAMTCRGTKVGIVADCAPYGRRAVHRPGGGHGYVVLSGPPSELILALFGRGRVAQFDVDGADGDVAAFERADLGF